MPANSVSIDSLHQIDLSDTNRLRSLIESGFSDSTNRRDHILAVADFAREVATAIHQKHPGLAVDIDEIERAALLHDIGYLPAVKEYLCKYTELLPTGWHPVDGAYFLRSRGEERLADLIEGHGNSLEVAKLQHLATFTISTDLAAMIITFCDCQTDPTGKRVDYESRLEEIKLRKGASSVEVLAHEQAKPRIRQIIEEIKNLIA